MTTTTCTTTGELLKECPSCPPATGPQRVENFYLRTAARGDGYQAKCKICSKRASAERHMHKSTTLSGRATKMSSATHTRSLSKGWPPSEMTPEFLMKLFKAQGGKCAKSGLEFDLLPHPDYDKNPDAPSVDRIDSNIHYTKTNVQLVCHLYNNGKASYTDDHMLKLALAIVERSGVVLAQAAEPRVVIPENEVSTTSGHPSTLPDGVPYA